MSNPFGYTGVFRYSVEYSGAVVPWWEQEDDLEDVEAELRQLIGDELGTVTAAAEFEAHRNERCPDYLVRAAVLPLPSPPWPVPDTQHCAWILYWEDDGELTVIEHPDRDHAVAAFFAHVAFFEVERTRYDYVVSPRKPQTAMPPGWKSRRL